MRKLLLSVLTVSLANFAFSQAGLKLKNIDSLVYLVKHSNLPVQIDSIISDKPEYGIFSKNLISVMIGNKELKKYTNKAYTRSTIGGKVEEANGENAFYFNNNKLIKVEESMEMGGKKYSVDWYFENDMLFYTNYAGKSERFDERPDLLISMANQILQSFRDRGVIE